jgi:hypothetical protein
VEEPVVEKVMLAIVCDSQAADTMVAHLEAAGVSRFTMFRGVRGVGETGRREGTQIWPGENAAMLCCLPKTQIPTVVAELKTLHDARHAHTVPLKIFSMPAEELL